MGSLYLRPMLGSFRAQFQMLMRDVEDMTHLIVTPLIVLVFMAIIQHAGRQDLFGYALVAPFLMTIAQVSLYAPSEQVTRERTGETLELVVATPTPFLIVIIPRILCLSLMATLGFAESWILIRFVFGIELTAHHPWVLVATSALTLLASAGTTLITAAVFALARSARILQNSVNYPLFLLSGVMIPVSLLPDWLQPISRVLFFYWSADLLRESMLPATPADVLPRLGAIAILGCIGAVIGGVLLQRMINRLRSEGTLGLT